MSAGYALLVALDIGLGERFSPVIMNYWERLLLGQHLLEPVQS
jgi:hypothetical protein